MKCLEKNSLPQYRFVKWLTVREAKEIREAVNYWTTKKDCCPTFWDKTSRDSLKKCVDFLKFFKSPVIVNGFMETFSVLDKFLAAKRNNEIIVNNSLPTGSGCMTREDLAQNMAHECMRVVKFLMWGVIAQGGCFESMPSGEDTEGIKMCYGIPKLVVVEESQYQQSESECLQMAQDDEVLDYSGLFAKMPFGVLYSVCVDTKRKEGRWLLMARRGGANSIQINMIDSFAGGSLFELIRSVDDDARTNYELKMDTRCSNRDRTWCEDGSRANDHPVYLKCPIVCGNCPYGKIAYTVTILRCLENALSSNKRCYAITEDEEATVIQASSLKLTGDISVFDFYTKEQYETVLKENGWQFRTEDEILATVSKEDADKSQEQDENYFACDRHAFVNSPNMHWTNYERLRESPIPGRRRNY